MFDALTRIGDGLHTRLRADEHGVAAVERGVIVGLVAVIIIGIVGTLGGTLFGWFDDTGLSTPR